MIFKKKQRGLTIEHQINIIEAEALHIKKTGSYILQVERPLPLDELSKISGMLKKQTGAQWIVINGVGKVAQNENHH